MSAADVLARTGPRKLLAVDGGGLRGLIAIEVLREVERQLQEAAGADDTFVLADYFDYIAGTSTGAMVATGLALGMRVSTLHAFYLEGSRKLFQPSRPWQRLQHRYRHEWLAATLRELIGVETTLGSDTLRTLLLIMRNASTNSPWPLSNNPNARYNQGPASNLELRLWQLVRASTAAPVYFSPEVITVGPKRFVFVDGGVTVYNNPAFQLFLMATAEPYRLGWETGTERMLLVSVGTGVDPQANADLQPGQMNLLYSATSVPAALMSGALHEQDLLCRMFGDTRHGDRLDSEVGDLRGVRGPGDAKLFSYLRYNAELSRAGLDRLGLPGIRPEQVQPLDAIGSVPELEAVGRALATLVTPEHFAGFAPKWGDLPARTEPR